jgi:hypothetical protein
MDVQEIIAELKNETERLNHAIAALRPQREDDSGGASDGCCSTIDSLRQSARLERARQTERTEQRHTNSHSRPSCPTVISFFLVFNRDRQRFSSSQTYRSDRGLEHCSINDRSVGAACAIRFRSIGSTCLH